MAMDAMGVASKDGISVDAQIGDRENDIQVDGARGAGDIKAKGNSTVNVNTTKNDSQIENAETVNIENIPPWVVLLLIIGWILPTPSSILKGAKAKWQHRTHRQQ